MKLVLLVLCVGILMHNAYGAEKGEAQADVSWSSTSGPSSDDEEGFECSECAMLQGLGEGDKHMAHAIFTDCLEAKYYFVDQLVDHKNPKFEDDTGKQTGNGVVITLCSLAINTLKNYVFLTEEDSQTLSDWYRLRGMLYCAAVCEEKQYYIGNAIHDLKAAHTCCPKNGAVEADLILLQHNINPSVVTSEMIDRLTVLAASGVTEAVEALAIIKKSKEEPAGKKVAIAAKAGCFSWLPWKKKKKRIARTQCTTIPNLATLPGSLNLHNNAQTNGATMKVFMLKDVENVGIAGQVVKVSEGYAANFLIPRKLAQEVTAKNEAFFAEKAKKTQVAVEVLNNKMSMLAERIKNIRVSITKRQHDDGKLYGAVSADDVVELLKGKDVSISKKQVVFKKSVRSVGTHKVAIKLSSKLTPEMTINVVGSEK